jgi:hypothetical protein
LKNLNSKRKSQHQRRGGRRIQIVNKSSLEEENNDVSVLNHPIWRVLSNDSISHLLENIAFSRAWMLQCSQKTKQTKNVLSSKGSPCLWP